MEFTKPVIWNWNNRFNFLTLQDQEYVAGASVDRMCHNSSKYLAEAEGGASKYGDYKYVIYLAKPSYNHSLVIGVTF